MLSIYLILLMNCNSLTMNIFSAIFNFYDLCFVIITVGTSMRNWLNMEKLNDSEYIQMLQLLHRYSETELDQWDLWKFDSKFGNIYITVSRAPNGPEESWDDVTHLLTPIKTSE